MIETRDYAAFTAQGLRAYQEDRYVLMPLADSSLFGAVIDGHCGAAVAELTAELLPSLASAGMFFHKAFRIIQNVIAERGLTAGACVAAFLLSGKDLTVAWVGDSRVVVVRKDSVEPLTMDHRFGNWAEQGRVLGAGGSFQPPYFYGPKTPGGLMPTRSLGDIAFESAGLIHDPEMTRTTVEPGDIIVAATDGLWDVIQTSDLPSLLMADRPATWNADQLLSTAFDRHTQDNVTVITVKV